MENMNHAKATVVLLTAGFEIESDYPPQELWEGKVIPGKTTFTHRNFKVVVPYYDGKIKAMFTGHIDIDITDLISLIKIMQIAPKNKQITTSTEGYDAGKDYLCEAYDDMVARGDEY